MTVEVTLEQVTGTPFCLLDSLVSVSDPPGQSDSIAVVPAETARFTVIATPLGVQAGDMANVFVSAEDAFGNDTNWSGALAVEDASTGVAIQGVSCQAGTPIYCRVPEVNASLVFRVVGDDGTEGTSNAISGAGDPAELDVVTSGTRSREKPLP